MRTIRRNRGNTKTMVFQVLSRNTKQPVDITDWTFRLVVHSIQYPPDDTTEVFAIAGVTINAQKGIVGFTPSALDAANIGEFWFEIEATDDSGLIDTLSQGPYRVREDKSNS